MQNCILPHGSTCHGEAVEMGLRIPASATTADAMVTSHISDTMTGGILESMGIVNTV